MIWKLILKNGSFFREKNWIREIFEKPIPLGDFLSKIEYLSIRRKFNRFLLNHWLFSMLAVLILDHLHEGHHW